jgi:predicted RNA-binding Zn-ribbon protein involved in translation (DUF1610 family)
VRCSVGGLIAALTTFPVVPAADKRALPAWSPATFAPGAPRRSEFVVGVECLVLDVDAGDPAVAFEAWPGLTAVLHTTWSHRPEAPRFRLVLPLARAVPASLWGPAWSWATERAPAADPACKDPARLYFRPAVPTASAPFSSQVQVGALLDLCAHVPDAPPPQPPIAAAKRRPVSVPARLRDQAVATRFAHDPATREAAAVELGAQLHGQGADQRATHVACPACGRPSVWFFVAPRQLRSARCNHRESCGWSGPLDALVGAVAA